MPRPETLLQAAGVPREALWNPSLLHPDERGVLHAEGRCPEAGERRARRERGRTLHACRCTYRTEVAPGWGTSLDLKVVALLLEAGQQARRAKGGQEAVERVVHLTTRVKYGEGVVRSRQGTPLGEVAKRVCEEAEEVRAETLRRVHQPREVTRTHRRLRWGGERILAEVTHAGTTREPYLGLVGGEAQLALELHTVARRGGAHLLYAPLGAVAAVEDAAGKVTSWPEQLPVHASRRYGTVNDAALETLTTLYQESEEETATLLEAARLLNP